MCIMASPTNDMAMPTGQTSTRVSIAGVFSLDEES